MVCMTLPYTTLKAFPHSLHQCSPKHSPWKPQAHMHTPRKCDTRQAGFSVQEQSSWSRIHTQCTCKQKRQGLHRPPRALLTKKQVASQGREGRSHQGMAAEASPSHALCTGGPGGVTYATVRTSWSSIPAEMAKCTM